MSADLEADPAPLEPAPRRRGGGSVRDLVLSLLVVLAIVGAIVLAAPRESDNPVRTIDYTSSLADARRTSPFDVVAPVGLSPQWRATSVRTDHRDNTTHWHVGFVTPKDEYASVEQSDRAPAPFVGEMTERGQTQGVLQIAGRTWIKTYSSLRNHRAFWNTTEGVSTVVGGTASWDELEALTGALRGARATG